MKANIHPQWYPQAKVTCACGNTFTVGSTRPEITVEICSACHPFFTGEMRFVDTMGRVEKFQQRQQALRQAQGKPVSKKVKKLLKKKQEEEEEAKRPKSLKEMLDRVRSAA